jgi:hypothetical protein
MGRLDVVDRLKVQDGCAASPSPTALVRTPNFASDGPARPGKTPVCTAVNVLLPHGGALTESYTWGPIAGGWNPRSKSTLLGGLRSAATCGNAGLHSGGCKIHGKDVLARQGPVGATHRLTTATSSFSAARIGSSQYSPIENPSRVLRGAAHGTYRSRPNNHGQ